MAWIRIALFPLSAGLFVLSGVMVDWKGGWLIYDQNRVMQIALLLIAGTVVASSYRGCLQLLALWSRTVRICIVLFFALGLTSALLAEQPEFSLLEWSVFILLFGVSLLVANAGIVTQMATERYFSALVASVALVVLLKVMIGYVAAMVEGVRLDTVLLFEGSFSNRRFFGQLATLLIPLMGWAFWVHKRFAIGWFILLCSWWMLLFVSGTRGSWVALAVAHTIVLLWVGRGAFAWGRAQLLAALLGFITYWFFFYFLPDVLGVDASIENRLDNLSTLSQREIIWKLGWQYMMENPGLGIGPMQFAANMNSVAAHPHNVVLQLAVEWGVPAMLAAAGVAAWGWLAFVRPLRRAVDPLRLALAVSLLGAGGQAMVDGVFVVPYTQTWLALIVGWAIGVHFYGRSVPVVPDAAEYALRMVGGVALIFLVWGATPQIFDRADVTAVYLEKHGSLWPRYWGQGWIP